MIKFVLENFDTIFRNEKSLESLNKIILDLAIRGKLVEQNPEDEPASELLTRIKEEKERLVKEKIIKKEKELPKIEEDEIPFEIPESWEKIKLYKLAFITKLAGFEYTNVVCPNLKEKGIPLFKGKNIQNGKLVLDFESYISEETSNILLRSQINKKCLLTPYVGTIGNIAIFDCDYKAHLGSNVGKIEFYNNNNKNILEEFALIYFRSNYGLSQLKKHKKATAQESISIEAIRDCIFLLPPLAEQKRIVEKVDRLQELIKNLKEVYLSNEESRLNLKKSLLAEIEKSNSDKELLKNLELVFSNFDKVIRSKEDIKDIRNLILSLAIKGKLVEQNPEDKPASELLTRIKEEKERLIKEKVIKKEKELPKIEKDEIPFEIPKSWEWVRLGEIIELLSGQDISMKECNSDEKGIPYLLGASNIIENKLIIERWIEKPKVIAIKNDILISCKGTVGKLIICNLEKVNLSRQLMGIRILKEISKEYMFIFLKSYVEKLKEKSKGLIPGIAREDILNIIFPLPPLAEQQRIVERVEKLMSICDMLEEKIVESERVSEKLLESLVKYEG